MTKLQGSFKPFIGVVLVLSFVAMQVALAQAQPRIDRIVEPIITPGSVEFIKEGNPISSGPPGTLLMLVGNGFGTDPTKVIANFGAKAVDVLPSPLFSETQIIVSVPNIPPGHISVSVTVNDLHGNEVTFVVEPTPSLPQTPGTTTRKFLTMLEAFMVLSSAEISILDFGTEITMDFKEQLVRDALEARQGVQLARDMLDKADKMSEDLIQIIEIKDPQAQELVRRIGSKVAEGSLSLLDQLIETSKLLPKLDVTTAQLRQGGKQEGTKMLEKVARIAEEVASVADSAQSIAAGAPAISASAGLIVSGDTETHPAEIIAGAIALAAKLSAATNKRAAEISKDADEAKQESERKQFEARIEKKLDFIMDLPPSQDPTRPTPIPSVPTGSEPVSLTKISKQLDTVNMKLDEEKRKKEILEDKLDKLEGKGDKVEVKLDRMENKLDRQEIKQDRIDGKLDKLAPQVMRLEAKLDNREMELRRLEVKAERAADKLDDIKAGVAAANSTLGNIQNGVNAANSTLGNIQNGVNAANNTLGNIQNGVNAANNTLGNIQNGVNNLQNGVNVANAKLTALQADLGSHAALMQALLTRLEVKMDRHIAGSSAASLDIPISSSISVAYLAGFESARNILDLHPGPFIAQLAHEVPLTSGDDSIDASKTKKSALPGRDWSLLTVGVAVLCVRSWRTLKRWFRWKP